MTYLNFYLGELLIFILFFLDLRFFNFEVIDYRMKKKIRKKRSKGQSFTDWLFFRRFKDVLEPFYLRLYFAHMIFCSFMAVFISVMYICGVPYGIMRICWYCSLIPYGIYVVLGKIVRFIISPGKFKSIMPHLIEKEYKKKK